jgi:hypothetical protein
LHRVQKGLDTNLDSEFGGDSDGLIAAKVLTWIIDKFKTISV